MPSSDSSEKKSEPICSGVLHPQALLGLRLFNQGNYFESHEAFETAWRAETGRVRCLYQGILQIGVAYHHIQHHNYRGAVNLLRRGCDYLARFTGTCREIDVARLRLGPQHIAFFDSGLLKQIIFDPASSQKEG